MEGYENAGRRVPARFATSGTVAAGAATNVVVTPQIPFRGENVVVDPATGAFFSLRELKVGTWPQNAGGEADLPCTMFDPKQAGAVNYEMDLCDAGTQITMNIVNTDSAAHAFVAGIWGHEIKKAAA